MNSSHEYRPSSYPLAYTLIVLPVTISRGLLFSKHHVPSAVTFFGASIFYLSGATNVVLFLIIRPGLLLFPRPRQLDEPEIPLTIQDDTGVTNFPDTAEFQHSPEPTSAVLKDVSFRDSATSSYVNSSQIPI